MKLILAALLAALLAGCGGGDPEVLDKDCVTCGPHER